MVGNCRLVIVHSEQVLCEEVLYQSQEQLAPVEEAVSQTPYSSVFFVLTQGVHKPVKPGIRKDFSEHGKLGEVCENSGKNCNKQSSFSSSFKYLCKTAVDWVNRIITISGSSVPAQ